MKTFNLSENDILKIKELVKKWDKSSFTFAIDQMSEAWTTSLVTLLDYKKTELKERFFNMIESKFERIADFTTFKDIEFDFKKVELQKTEITTEEIKELVLNNGLTITKVIDTVIDLNGIIGVGLISLGDDLKTYVHRKIIKQQ